jgi:hypothetical protein
MPTRLPFFSSKPLGYCLRTRFRISISGSQWLARGVGPSRLLNLFNFRRGPISSAVNSLVTTWNGHLSFRAKGCEVSILRQLPQSLMHPVGTHNLTTAMLFSLRVFDTAWYTSPVIVFWPALADGKVHLNCGREERRGDSAHARASLESLLCKIS